MSDKKVYAILVPTIYAVYSENRHNIVQLSDTKQEAEKFIKDILDEMPLSIRNQSKYRILPVNGMFHAADVLIGIGENYKEAEIKYL